MNDDVYEFEYGEGLVNVNGILVWNKNKFTHSRLDVVRSQLENKKQKVLFLYLNLNIYIYLQFC